MEMIYALAIIGALVVVGVLAGLFLAVFGEPIDPMDDEEFL